MLDLSNYLPYLLNRAGSRIAAEFSRAVRDHDITLPIWRVLAALDHRDGQRVGELAELTAIEISTLSRVLDLMQRKGLAKRRRLPGDARSVVVYLTARGRQLTQRIIPLARRYETVALAGFSEAEAAMLKSMLQQLYRNLAALPQPTELPRGA